MRYGNWNANMIPFEGIGNVDYPIKYVDINKRNAYEDIHWVRTFEDGHIEDIDVGGPRK